jgi:hypothetical protein
VELTWALKLCRVGSNSTPRNFKVWFVERLTNSMSDTRSSLRVPEKLLKSVLTTKGMLVKFA